MPLLDIKTLSVSFHTSGGATATAVQGVSFSLKKGQTLALVGESGSGKTVTALSILKLLPYPMAFHPSGQILFDGTDLLQAKESALRSVRGNRISMIFQEPMTSLNPLHTIQKQLSEAVTLHQPHLHRFAVKKRAEELLHLVGLEALVTRMHAYPHELSGGQRQRVMIAMALANEPDILIADEPTTALDVTVQKQILALLQQLQEKLGMAVLLITHDLPLVKRIAHTVAVMQGGRIVEQGKTADIFAHPSHPYTRHLLSCEPKGNPPDAPETPKDLLEVHHLDVRFAVKKGAFGRPTDYVTAVDNITFRLQQGKTLGVVGESGSGKTTLARAVLRLVSADGDIIFNGRNMSSCNEKTLQPLRRNMQLVFQDPFSSLNPRMTVAQIVEEGLRAHHIGTSPQERAQRVADAMEQVGLDTAAKNRFPHEFSGGQRQRIGIARAIVLNPSFLVLDEPTSALDLSLQTEIIDLLRTLQKQRQISYLFISHDLRVIKAMAHDIIVMREGKIVEQGTRDQIFTQPQEEYTRLLVDAAFAVPDYSGHAA